MLFLVSCIIIGVILFGLFYLIKFIANKFLLIESFDNNELIKEEEHSNNWTTIKSYAVIGTPYYSIIQTQDDHYFLVKHNSLKNLFVKISTWSANEINESDAKQAIDNSSPDRSLVTLGGISAILIFLSNTFMGEPHWLWFLNISDLFLVMLFIIVGTIIGALRIKFNLKKYEEHSTLLTHLGKPVRIQIISNQRWTIVVPLLAYLVLIIMPLPILIKGIFWGLIFIEIVPRMFSSIATSKRKKDSSQVTKTQKYLYGDDASWINFGEPSEININYKEQL